MVAFRFYYFLTEGVKWLYSTLLNRMNNCDFESVSKSMIKNIYYHHFNVFLIHVDISRSQKEMTAHDNIANVIFNRISLNSVCKLYA